MFLFRKRPGEIIAGIGIDFSACLPANVTMLGLCSAETGLTIAATNSVGKIITTTVSGGTAGRSYILTFTVIGADGSERIGRITIKVEA